MLAFESYMRRSFENRMVQHICDAYPEQLKQITTPANREQALRELIGDGIARARKYDLEAEKEVARFIEFMVCMAPRFDEMPEFRWARVILDDRKISSGGRVELIHQQWESRGHATTTSAAAIDHASR
jgi:hypothetical protein